MNFRKLLIMSFCAVSSVMAWANGIDTCKNVRVVSAEQMQAFAVENSQPAGELYHNIWTSERLNPYRVAIDSMPDTLQLDVAEFYFPTKSSHITSNFGFRKTRYHYGVDIGLRTGDTIYSSFTGKVRIVDYEAKGYGHYVVIRHNNGLETVSAHMSKVLVKQNQEVKAGQPIGLGGSTGHSTGPHLHWELRLMGNAFNPLKLIDFDNRIVVDGCYTMTIAETYSHKRDLAMRTASSSSVSRTSTTTNSASGVKKYHRVKQNDTLSGIARRYGTTVDKLCKLNKISKTSVLRIGQSIRYI